MTSAQINFKSLLINKHYIKVRTIRCVYRIVLCLLNFNFGFQYAHYEIFDSDLVHNSRLSSTTSIKLINFLS